MSLDIKDFLGQYVKPSALKLGGEDAITEITSGGTIPSTAKIYIPDTQGILDDIFYILQNEPISATDSVFSNFSTPRVFDLTNSISAPDFYNKGIYEENDYVSFGNDIRNIGYSGVINNGAFGGNNDYSGTNVYFVASFIDDTYSSIGNFVSLSFKTDVEISYDFDASDNTAVETSFYISNNGILISFAAIVDNSVSPASAIYSLQVFG